MNRIISFLFGNSIASLQQECSDAISLFQKTLIKLEKASAKITTVKDKKVMKITKLQQEQAILDEMLKENDGFTAKVKEFLT